MIWPLSCLVIATTGQQFVYENKVFADDSGMAAVKQTALMLLVNTSSAIKEYSFYSNVMVAFIKLLEVLTVFPNIIVFANIGGSLLTCR